MIATSWTRAIDGIRQATRLGLPVRDALTETPENTAEIPEIAGLLASIGLQANAFAVRPLLRRGLSGTGLGIDAGATIPGGQRTVLHRPASRRQPAAAPPVRRLIPFPGGRHPPASPHWLASGAGARRCPDPDLARFTLRTVTTAIIRAPRLRPAHAKDGALQTAIWRTGWKAGGGARNTAIG